MTTFARQVDALAIADEHALEGFFYFSRVREEKASKYPDYVEARQAASASLRKLAIVESAFGTARVSNWLDELETRALAQLAEKEAS